MGVLKSIFKNVCKVFFGREKDGFRYPQIEGIGGGLYKVVSGYSAEVVLIGWRVVITIDPGYVFDGASIPRWLWPIAGHPLESPHDAASLIHDRLYTAHILSRRQSDWVYAQILAQAGLAYWRIALEWIVLRFFGQKAWDAASDEDAASAAQFGLITYYSRKDKSHE